MILTVASCGKDNKNQKNGLVIKTVPATEITRNSAKSGGEIESDGGDAIIERGVCWAAANNPTIDDNYLANVSAGIGNYKTIISGLSNNTTYYIRAYATTAKETVYGNELSFSTTNLGPELTTATATGKTGNTGLCGGYISNDGGSPILARGVCWSTDANPDLTDSFTKDGADTGAFVSELTGLTCSTTYYVRAYATNSAGTSYGNEVSFTTGLEAGDNYLGGVVYYLLQPNDWGYDANYKHGLVIAKENLSTTAPWGCQGIDVLISYAVIGWGQESTKYITAYDSDKGIAGRLCTDITINGYSGWFLPTVDELRVAMNRSMFIDVGGFGNGLWWTSTQQDADYATMLRIPGATIVRARKSDKAFVRPVRSF